MKRARHFWFASLRSYHATRQHHLLFVRALVLACIPFLSTRKIEDGNLRIFVLYAGPAVFGKRFYPGGPKPNSYVRVTNSGFFTIACLHTVIDLCAKLIAPYSNPSDDAAHAMQQTQVWGPARRR